jgi:hypothetical protein
MTFSNMAGLIECIFIHAANKQPDCVGVYADARAALKTRLADGLPDPTEQEKKDAKTAAREKASDIVAVFMERTGINRKGEQTCTICLIATRPVQWLQNKTPLPLMQPPVSTASHFCCPLPGCLCFHRPATRGRSSSCDCRQC